jgi:hypothetical protein
MAGRAVRAVGRVTLACLVIGQVLLATALPVAAEATVTVSPTTPDGWFKVRVRGYFRTENLSTWLTGPSQQIVVTDEYETGDNGRADFRLFMLRHYQPGQWAITVVGQRSQREVIAHFDVPDRGKNAIVTMAATSLRVGDTVAVTGQGFRRNERISYWYTLPDGTAARGQAETTADGDGVVLLSLTVTQPDLEPGGWALSIYGHASDAYGVTTFEVVTSAEP